MSLPLMWFIGQPQPPAVVTHTNPTRRRARIAWSKEQDLRFLQLIRDNGDWKRPNYTITTADPALPRCGNNVRDTKEMHKQHYWNLRDKAFKRANKRDALSIEELITFVKGRDYRFVVSKLPPGSGCFSAVPITVMGKRSLSASDGETPGTPDTQIGSDEDITEDSEHSTSPIPLTDIRFWRIRAALLGNWDSFSLEFMLTNADNTRQLVPAPEHTADLMAGELTLQLRPPLSPLIGVFNSVVSMLLSSPCGEFVHEDVTTTRPPLGFLVKMMHDQRRPLYIYPLAAPTRLQDPAAHALFTAVGPHHLRGEARHHQPDTVHFAEVLKEAPKEWMALFFVSTETEQCAPLLCLRPSTKPDGVVSFHVCAPPATMRLVLLGSQGQATRHLVAEDGTILSSTSSLLLMSAHAECEIFFK